MTAEIDKTTQIEAATFRRLLSHLEEHANVQNIDLMNLANFCRNCLAKWYADEADQQGIKIDYDTARLRIYGMPYDEWKALHQKPATAEQIERFEARRP